VSNNHDAVGPEDPVQLRDQLLFCRSIHLLSPVGGIRPSRNWYSTRVLVG
jgi:hypothetical protein